MTLLNAILRRLMSMRRRAGDAQAWEDEERVESIVGDSRNLAMPAGWRGVIRPWLQTKFPVGSTDDDVDELKADLVYWDLMVADVALPLNEGRRVSRGVVDIPAGLRAYRARVLRLLADPAHEEAAKLREYVNYCGLLENVYALAEQRLASPEDADTAGGPASS